MQLELLPPKKLPIYRVLIPGTNQWHLLRREDIYRCDEFRDLEMERLSRIVGVGTKCHHKCPYKKDRKGFLTQRRVGLI